MYRDSALAVAKQPQDLAFIGVSTVIQELRAKVDRVAATQSPVLILGETGTGKEVVARRIHQRSGLRKFVPIDCSVLVGPLMESELFGYTKGAFTGAESSRQGLLDEAHLGTAFFDEVGELPLALQVKLLRVLQEREFRPVGSTIARSVECRVVAATNRNLSEEVEKGRFRQDLFYRLNVITLRIPPLRERREDIPLLAEHFLRRFAPMLEFSPEVLDVFVHYDWPGNVRELENSVLRMVAVSTALQLRIVDLPSPIANFLRSPRMDRRIPSSDSRIPPRNPKEPRVSYDPSANPILPLVEVERRAILAALEATKGDRTTASQLLGIGRTTLYRKLKSYGADA
jgi:DNA-binding NtrC family response regulator